MQFILNNLNNIIIVQGGLLKDPLWNKEAFVGKKWHYFLHVTCKMMYDLANVFMKLDLLAKYKC